MAGIINSSKLPSFCELQYKEKQHKKKIFKKTISQYKWCPDITKILKFGISYSETQNPQTIILLLNSVIHVTDLQVIWRKNK